MFRSPPGSAATGSPRLPPGKGIIEELDLHGVEVAAAPFEPLGVDPTPSVRSRSESSSWWRGHSWPSCLKPTSSASRSCHRASSTTAR